MANPHKWGVSAVILGDSPGITLDTLAQHGADRVFFVPSERPAAYCPEKVTEILVDLLKAHLPWVLLFPVNDVTNDLAPRIAARMRVGLIPRADRLHLSDDGTLTATRICFQRKIQATVVCPDARPQMATVGSGVMKVQKDTRKDRVPCECIEVNPETCLAGGASRVKVLRFIKADPKKIDISDADLIVCGGKGGGDKAQFEKIKNLADLLGAALAGSRVAVDNGCIGRERQIGQSGKSVSPELMISCGVSGANAHTFGMREAKTVIAINKDKNAPIIKLADLGVVGDLHEILPRLNHRIKKYLDQINPEKR